MKTEEKKEIAICWECRHAEHLTTLDLYDISCNLDGDIRDENDGCINFCKVTHDKT